MSMTVTVADPGFLIGSGGGSTDVQHGCFLVKMYVKMKSWGRELAAPLYPPMNKDSIRYVMYSLET